MLTNSPRSWFTRLATLPRDSRDTLFLLLVVAWVILPQVGSLPAWASAVAALALLWRARLAWRSAPLPGRWWLLGLLVICVAATLATYRTIAGREAGVTLVVMLLALKTLEMRARRDAMVVFFLGFFTMLTSFFVSQSLPTALAMVVALLGLLTALVQAHMPVSRSPLSVAAKTAGRMMLLGAPIMLALFLFFPRLSPLWGVPGDPSRGRSGLSADMRVGTIAQLALDEGVAMRVRFDTPNGKAPPQQDLYFRGPVLARFDGRNWRPLQQRFGDGGSSRAQPPAGLQVAGAPVRYEVTLEPNGHPWLLALDAAPQKPEGVPAAYLTSDLQWIGSRPITQLLRYRAESYPDFRHGPLQMTPALRPFTELPDDFDPRTHALARQMVEQVRASGAEGPAATRALVAAALERLRTGGYVYTLDPGIYGDNTADQFWFDTKAGFCEHIASAFVVLMRAMDIPARIVTGYQGGEPNNVDGYWTVRQSDAHAWTEVWEAGRGWVRVDPTASVAPSRIGQLLRLQAPQGAFAQAFGTVIGAGLVQRLRATWEAVNNGWNQWVLNYTQDRQLNLLKRLGISAPDWQDLVRVLALLLATASLVAVAWAATLRRRRDPWLQLLARARRRLERAGLTTPATTPPRTLAAQAAQRFGDGSQPLSDWLLRLEAQRYAAADPAARRNALRALRRDFARLPWPTAASARPLLHDPATS